MSKEATERWHAAAHAMQSGVAASPDKGDQSPKHLRVGVNAAMADHGSLVRLLVAKGVFTVDEYEDAIAEGMELEVKKYEAELTAHYGKPVKLK